MASESEQDRRETLAVIAEMRDEAARADTEQYYTLDDAAESMREFANRLEAALKRERESVTKCNGFGNAAAMRESESVFPRGDYEAMLAALMRVESEMIRLIDAEGSRVPFQPRAVLDDVEHVLKNLGGARC